MLFDLLSIFDWITPAIGLAHNIKRLPDDIRHVARGEPLSEHTLFVASSSYAQAKDILARLGISQISVDVFFPLAREWSVLIPTSEVERVWREFYQVGIKYRD